MAKRTSKPHRLYWLDLEMTGFDPHQDLITEVAVVITDFNFKVLAQYQSGVYQDRQALERRWKLNPWFAEQSFSYQTKILQCSQQGSDLALVEEEMVALATKHISNEPVILAGNTIYVDRQFVQSCLPKLAAKLHYRLFDVSTFKICLQTKYDVFFEKKEAHRALDDVLESIEELKFYLQYFKK